VNARKLGRLSVESFESGAIDVDAFDHEAHVYIAWCYFEAFPPALAADRFCAALQRLTGKIGVPDKYHETITRFFLHLIAERRGYEPEEDWPAFRRRNKDLCSGAAALLQYHYSQELLSSDRARVSFVSPDRCAA
jgi:hypothetical protein